MLNRIILSIVFLSSLAWIGYVGLDILSNKSNYSPTELFGESDGELLIVNRSAEVDFMQLNNFKNAPTFNLMRNINSAEYQTAFFSAKQSHLLLQRLNNWTEKDIKSLFINDSLIPNFTNGNFTIGEYEGRFFKKNLYLKKNEPVLPNQTNEKFKYDKKASASIINFGQNSIVLSVSDVYFKPDGKINFITHNDNIKQGNQVKDEILFSGIVTRKFDSYHFYERDYYATLDDDYRNGPMPKWILNGFLELEYEGSKVIITDYISGQDPMLILNDLNQEQGPNKFSAQLTERFPSKGSSYFVSYLEDLVVISESEDVCNKIIADFKLGNTIALDKNTRTKLYGNLPASVSERMVTKEESYSKAVYDGRILESQIGSKSSLVSVKTNETFSFNCGFDIQDFVVLNGQKNVVALGKKGEVTRVLNGKTQWTKSVASSSMGKIQIIDLHDSGEKFILFNTPNKIYLWSLSGAPVSGFPIDLESEASNEVKFYRWKGASYFIIADIKDRVWHFDAKGRELNIIKSEISITHQIDVWASQRILFAGFANDDFFVMYNLDRKKKHRDFRLNTSSISSKIPNELIHFAIDDNKLVKMDQKGIKFNFSSFNNAKLLAVQSNRGNPIVIVKSANEIHLLNIDGIPFGQITLPFNEVEDVFVETNHSGKISVAVIDGLENNVYLYGTNGERVIRTSLEGQTKVVVSSEDNNKIITTVVDQFIVQYFEN